MGQIIEAVSRLDQGCLFIQGPPEQERPIQGLISSSIFSGGARIGVSSNSHKAINNLLSAVEKAAVEKKLNSVELKNRPLIPKLNSTGSLSPMSSERRHPFRELAPDCRDRLAFFGHGPEPGLSLCRRGWTGCPGKPYCHGGAAKNIVLLGDQMQLGQPIQGFIPAVGESSLDYLLNGVATIPPTVGFFSKPPGGCIKKSADLSRMPSMTAG